MEQPKLDYIKEISGGDTDFEKEMMSVLKNEFPTEKQTYYKHVANDDRIAIAEIVHKIKHKFSILGLEEGYEIAVIYENNLREGVYSKRKEFEKKLDVVSDYLTLL